ncbi:MAG: bacillithiol biosynthesis cysteine-adding enzyme BshC [Saprospiraceae bacterium]|nr:bacillithiol biosynthesis cysteine-adding enzyme BshC [Saprospiraceae bacterium]
MTKFRTASLEYDSIEQFSRFDKGFQNRDDGLLQFVGQWPTLDNLISMLEAKNFDNQRRKTLVEVLSDQYRNLGHYNDHSSKIEKLRDDNTFTITTAHQPVLLGGPLYVPYKIASAIQLCRMVNERSSEKEVIPIFIVGGEDHDFDEINHCHLFGNRIEWQHESGGPVGRFDLEGLQTAIDEAIEILGNGDEVMDVKALLSESFSQKDNYAQAYQDYIIRLFGKYGCLVLNMDEVRLKSGFMPLMKAEVESGISQPLVEKVQKKKEEAGYGAQTYVRQINLFYLDENVRSVILKLDNGSFRVRDLDLEWDEKQLISKLEQHPENFSPNVVMRPIYQEFTLPNIAYIGGGGELSYWSERQDQFKAFDVDFPILVRRKSVIHIESFIYRRMVSLGLDIDELVIDKHEVIKKLVSQDTTLDDKLKDKSKDVLHHFSKLVELLEDQAESLGKYAKSEERKLEKTLENFQDKSFREIKKEADVKVGKIEKVYDHIFPENGLQERYVNVLQLLNRHGRKYLDFLVSKLNPLETDVTVIIED